MCDDRPPDTDSIPDLAEYWDKHDLTDFESELKEIEQAVFRKVDRQ